MKNLILSAVVMLSLVFNASATTEPVNQKVLSTFHQVFKDAHRVSWSHTGSYYEAFFEVESVKTRAMLNKRGALIQTIRYYKENELPSNVLYSVKKDFTGNEIVGITEISNKYGINYRIVLRDSKYYTHINADNAGETEVVAKYKRGDK